MSYRNLSFKRVQLTLGKHYKLNIYGKIRICQLIKPTVKGFDFLGEDSKCLLPKGRLYPADFKNKNLPKGQDTFYFDVPDYIVVMGEVPKPITTNFI